MMQYHSRHKFHNDILRRRRLRFGLLQYPVCFFKMKTESGLKQNIRFGHIKETALFIAFRVLHHVNVSVFRFTYCIPPLERFRSPPSPMPNLRLLSLSSLVDSISFSKRRTP